MLQTLLITSLLAFTAAAAPGQPCKKATCNADNCLRAVRATSPVVEQPHPSQDCQSYFASTSHATVLPTYAASACSNSARYLSACSCAGFLGAKPTTPTTATPSSAFITTSVSPSTTPSTTTATSPTTTSTTTTIAASASLTLNISPMGTSSSSVSPTTTTSSLMTSDTITISPITTPSSATTTTFVDPPCSTVALQAASGPFTGQYLLSNSQFASYFIDYPDATGDARFTFVFEYDQTGRLVSRSQTADILTSHTGTSLVQLMRYSNVPDYVVGPPTDYDSGPHGIYCSIPLQPGSAATKGQATFGGAVTCQGWTGNEYGPLVFQVCPNATSLDNTSELLVDEVVATAFDPSCQAIAIVAVAACDNK